MRNAWLCLTLLVVLLDSCSGPPPSEEWYEVVSRQPGPEVTDPVMREKIEQSGHPWKVRDRATGIEMVLVMPGEFMMGSPESEPDRKADEGPQHRVRLTRAFYLGATEVTKAQWKHVMGESKGFFRGEHMPANVSREDTREFFARANAGIPEGTKPLRLPTEAEWEYAGRAGTTGPFSFEGPPGHHVMNFLDGVYETARANASEGDHEFVWETPPSPEARLKAAPAGSLPPNAWGVHEMHGNVAEFTADKYISDAYSHRGALTIDPFVQGTDDEAHSMRGGDWARSADQSRSAARYAIGRYGGSSRIGFRVVRTAHVPVALTQREQVAPMKGFSWVVPGKLAAMPVPGRERPLDQDAAFLEQEGIRVLVSLTEEAADPDVLASHRIDQAHIPVKDFTAPTIEQMIDFVAVVENSADAGKPVGVHCTAGLGRSGTMLAVFLVADGATTEEATVRVRQLRPGSIETPDQEEAIRRFEQHVATTR